MKDFLFILLRFHDSFSSKQLLRYFWNQETCNRFCSKNLEDTIRAIKLRSKWILIQQDFHLVFFTTLVPRIYQNLFFFFSCITWKHFFIQNIIYTKAFLDFYQGLLIIKGDCSHSCFCTCSRRVKEHYQKGAMKS